MPPNDPSPWQPPVPGSSPPPPPPPVVAAPPPPPSGPPGGAPGFGHPGAIPPAAYGVPVLVGAAKPPRPRTKVAGLLMLFGGAVMIVGTALPWISDGGDDYNAFDQWRIGSLQEQQLFYEDTPVGPLLVFLALIMIGFGIATVAAGRVLAVMIIGIVVGAFAVLGTLNHLADYADVTDSTASDLGVGIIVAMFGSGVALAGAIAGCATRRKW